MAFQRRGGAATKAKPKQEYDNTNRGVLFENDRKETENQPDYTGSLDVDGEEFRLAAWIRESQQGQEYMSLAITPVEGDDSPAPAARGRANKSRSAAASGDNPATAKQQALLRKHGYDPGVTFDDASTILDELAANNWQRPDEDIPAFN
jgi:hypothetical protein